MEEQLIREFYNEYLESVLEVSYDKSLYDWDLVEKLRHTPRYVAEKQQDGVYIRDSVTGLYTGKVANAKCEYNSYIQGLFKFGLGIDDEKRYDINGRIVDTDVVVSGLRDKKINVIPVISRRSISGRKKVFFNDVTNSYEKAIYSPLCFEVSFDYGPYDDYTAYETIPLESSDYILFVSEDERVFLYRKGICTYEELKYDKSNKLDSEFNVDKNVIRLNNTYYYVTPYEIIDISHIIRNVKWRYGLSIKLLTEKLIDYDQFRIECLRNKDFYKLLREKIKEEKKAKAEKDLEETKKLEIEEKQLKISKRKKDILLEVKKLLGEYYELSKEQGKDSEYMVLDEDIFFIDVDDHKEISPMFINYLSIIDLSGFSFKNVKVSGVNFSNSNAYFNPQDVYNKDMSNSLFRGLDFNVADFTGVNITNSDFTDCIMDFAKLENAIRDENTILPKRKSIKH